MIALERYPLDRGQLQGPVQRRPGRRPRRRHLHPGRRRGAAAWRDRHQAGAAARDRPVGRSADLPTGARGRLVCGPRYGRVPQLAGRYRTRYGQEPARTASLAYDAVALVAALVKTQGAQRFSEEVLTNSSGFTGIDGLFRLRPDGTNQRGLAVMGVAGRRPSHQPAAEGVRGVGNVTSTRYVTPANFAAHSRPASLAPLRHAEQIGELLLGERRREELAGDRLGHGRVEAEMRYGSSMSFE